MARPRVPSFRKRSFRRRSFRKNRNNNSNSNSDSNNIKNNCSEKNRSITDNYNTYYNNNDNYNNKTSQSQDHDTKSTYEDPDTLNNIANMIKSGVLTSDVLYSNNDSDDSDIGNNTSTGKSNDIKKYSKYARKNLPKTKDVSVQCDFAESCEYYHFIHSLNNNEDSSAKYRKEPTSRWPWVVISLLLVVAGLGGLCFWDKIPQPKRGVAFYYKTGSMQERLPLNTSTWSLSTLPLDPQQTLYFIIHGYGEASSLAWIQQLTQALLIKESNSTIILVDYWDFVELDGRRSCNNLRIVADKLAELLDDLVDNRNLKLSQVHLIGYSLGGRVTGMVRHRLKTNEKIGRITALDASHPWIEPYDESDYVDTDDADLVVTVKTSAISARTPGGHIDVLFNGGYIQPGCDHWMYPVLIQQACSHTRAYKYMIEAVTLDNILNCSKQPHSSAHCPEFDVLNTLPDAKIKGPISIPTNSIAPYFV